MASQTFTPEESASRIAGLVLLNAMMFQEVLASHNSNVLPLAKVICEPNPVQKFHEHWTFIIEDIDYYSIFCLAREVAGDLTADPDVSELMIQFARTAQQIVSRRAALRHDLAGRIYHRLLVEAKYLGTYYTGVPAAALLLGLALKPDSWSVDWGDLDAVASLRIADLACGTGTLLMAAAEAVTDNHVAAAASGGDEPDIVSLQRELVESVLLGYDVLSSAVHLTASTLALRAPEVPFERMNLWAMPLGGEDARLGSLDFLAFGAVQARLWGALGEAERVKGKEDAEQATKVTTTVPELDLCVMNPPFTRSVGGNLLFGSLPDEQRRPLQEKLKKLVRSETVLANITAGLGSVFVATGHKYVKGDGRMALVLPKSVLSGVAWQKTRALLARDYVLEWLVCSHDPEWWNFSENTSLSEVLLVARRISESTDNSDGPAAEKEEEAPAQTVAVNLWRNPSTSFEALAVAQQLAEGDAPTVAKGQGALRISLGDQTMGEAVAMPWKQLHEAEQWMLPCAFAQAGLIRAAYYLGRKQLWLPGTGVVGHLPLCPLADVAVLGPDRRDVHDGFERVETETEYPAFWGHLCDQVRTLAQQPNDYLAPLSAAKDGRPLRKATDLWPRGGRLLVAERLRLNTQRVAAVCLPEQVLSNVWWPMTLQKECRPGEAEKALTLWTNSTLGLLAVLSQRQETEGPWIDFKKPVLARSLVLDPRLVQDRALGDLADAYDVLCQRDLQPFAEIAVDPVRAAIDEALCDALNMPGVSALRRMLAREPILSLRRLGA